MSIRTSFAARLDAEWKHLASRPDTIRALKRAAAGTPGLPLDPNRVVAEIKTASSERRETLVRALAEAAQRTAGADGQTAARILLEALRPLAVRLAGKRPVHETFESGFEQAVAAVYEAIRTVPLTRGGAVLANIRMEAVTALWGENRAHHPEARRALHHAAPLAFTDAVTPAAVLRNTVTGAGPAADARPADQHAIDAASAAATRALAGAAGLLAGDPDAERVELLELLLWAVDQHVITRRQAQVLAEHGHAERAPGASRATDRARERAITKLREAAPRYLAALAA